MGKVYDFEIEKLKFMKEEKRMKLTMKEVVEIGFRTVQKLSMIEGKVPIKTTYRIGKLEKKMEKIVKDFNEARQKLFLKYGTTDEKTKQMNILPENVEAFQKEIEDFVNQEIEIEVMPVSLIELYKCEKRLGNQPYQISGKEMFDVPYLWSDIDEMDALLEEEDKKGK